MTDEKLIAELKADAERLATVIKKYMERPLHVHFIGRDIDGREAYRMDEYDNDLIMAMGNALEDHKQLFKKIQIPSWKIGDQIAYIPSHAEGNVYHPDVEFGFIMKVAENGAFCRFWRRKQLGELRTVANSEFSKWDNLIAYQSVPQEVVESIIARML